MSRNIFQAGKIVKQPRDEEEEQAQMRRLVVLRNVIAENNRKERRAMLAARRKGKVVFLVALEGLPKSLLVSVTDRHFRAQRVPRRPEGLQRVTFGWHQHKGLQTPLSTGTGGGSRLHHPS